MCFQVEIFQETKFLRVTKTITLSPHYLRVDHTDLQECSVNKRGVGTHPKNLAVSQQLQTNVKAKHEKGVGTPFPRVPALLNPC